MSSRSCCALARMMGSSAPNGSSISSTFGSAASARATPTRCCWPTRELVRKFVCVSGRLELEHREQFVDPGVYARAAPSPAAAGQSRCSPPPSGAGTARCPGWHTRCAAAASAPVPRRCRCHRSAPVRCVGSTSRLIMRSNVDFPDPEVPTITVIVRGSMHHRHLIDHRASVP